MKLLLFLCFTSFLNLLVFATDPRTPDPLCEGVKDFQFCKTLSPPPTPTLECNENSQCFCKGNVSFCRCKNYKDTWYLGEKCDQKWTVVTFALVASLPGVTLAIIVGVIVQVVNQMTKSQKKSKGPKGVQPNMAHTLSNGELHDQDGSYSNMVFASDLQSRPVAPRGPLPQDRIPMGPTGPMGRQFSPQSNEMRPPFDRTALPPSNSNQQYNHGAGMNQPTQNPYGRPPVLRDPYENATPPSNRYDERMRPTYAPPGQNMMRGDMSGYPGPNIPPPTQPAPYRNPSFQIPKAHMERPY